jgi:hypothetical protein
MRASKNHDLTSNSPQLHHKNTTLKHHFSHKPPVKTQSHHAKKNTVRQKAEPHSEPKIKPLYTPA